MIYSKSNMEYFSKITVEIKCISDKKERRSRSKWIKPLGIKLI